MSEGEQGTFWNGERCKAERCTVVVADDPCAKHYWARELVGTERKAVAVEYNGITFFIDDEGFEMTEEQIAALLEKRPDLPESFVRRKHGYPGWGWDKVTKGGGPSIPHANLAVERIVETAHDHAV